ncbi:hypothetical protein ABT009_45815 [Streptomyces sp. NPDC002896]|uniref:hypothetical protein n=1 Tax=Streptomyces sp. NPDC002896 TaxID=3154438 RepID=UPI00331C8E67
MDEIGEVGGTVAEGIVAQVPLEIQHTALYLVGRDEQFRGLRGKSLGAAQVATEWSRTAKAEPMRSTRKAAGDDHAAGESAFRAGLPGRGGAADALGPLCR